MRVLITGGTGFLAGRLAEHLSIEGHNVIVCTRNSNYFNLINTPVTVKHIDWQDEKSIADCCKNIDVIIHAAGMNASQCADSPSKASHFNGEVTARMLETASKCGVNVVLFLSTAHVYGDPLTGTISEETPPINTHPYALSNLAGEYTVLKGAAQGGIKGIVVRISNVYGSPSNAGANCWHLFVNDLCMQASKNRKLVLRQKLQQYRDFLGANEFCRAIQLLIDNPLQVSMPEIINIGSGVSLSLEQMASLIKRRSEEVLGFSPEIVSSIELSLSETQVFRYAISKLETIGYTFCETANMAELDNLLRYCADKQINK